MITLKPIFRALGRTVKLAVAAFQRCLHLAQHVDKWIPALSRGQRQPLSSSLLRRTRKQPFCHLRHFLVIPICTLLPEVFALRPTLSHSKAIIVCRRKEDTSIDVTSFR